MDATKTKNIGLRGVVVADTKISDANSEKGQLIYRGFNIETLAAHSTFEETAYLLIHGQLPTAQQLVEFDSRLKEARPVPREILHALAKLPVQSRPMDVLQASLCLLAPFDPDLQSESRAANIAKGIRIIAKTATVVAAWDRIRRGAKPLAPKPELSHAANFLWMLHGKVPREQTAKDLDVCLILHADHSFNASTFVSRVTTSTRAHMYASVSSAVGTLSGALHGGANTKVMEMLSGIQKPELVADWIKARLASGERIMGMGHATYKTEDPRVKPLRTMAAEWTERENQHHWFEMISRIEEVAREEFDKRGKTFLYPNVDLYSPLVYRAMKIPTDLFTPVFAIARTAGWTAHILEEKFADAQGKPALYQPQSHYTGKQCGDKGRPYVPLSKRI